MRVHIDKESCIALASPLVGCTLCRDRCPTGAISLSDNSIGLDSGRCLACGHCAAVCPSEAIAVEDFAIAKGTAPTYECGRVDPLRRVSGAGVVSCLGGLSTASLLSAVRCARQSVTIVDRGWCQDCPAGGGGRPWSAQVDEANSILADFGARRVHVVELPLPKDTARTLPESLGGIGSARRRLFRSLVRPEGNPQERIEAGGVRKVDARALRRRHEAIAGIADAGGMPISAQHYPAVAISDACRDSRVCVAACPTEALSDSSGDGASAVVFHPAVCTSCGACESACPSDAIRFAAAGHGRFQEDVVLRRAPRETCRTCGADFTPQGGETICPPCRSSADLAREAFQLLRRPSPERGECLKP